MKNILSLLFLLLLSISAPAATVATMIEDTATTTSTEFLDANIDRRYLLIQNRGANSIHVKVQSAHDVGEQGVVIIAGGNWEPFNVPVDKIFIKSASSTSDFTIVEGK